METIKKLLAIMFWTTIMIIPANSQTLHAIIFANTKCPGEKPGSMGIGPSVTCDYQRMKIEFETKTFNGTKEVLLTFAVPN